ncbi:ATP-dependent nuclease [Pseudomonas asiatica]|uniref:ATP-dependent nuclease n=1 Tax=Pseudomonas TaxID=286 RepID=UPI000A1E4107|nr:ATP-binding protein [Pseudomonas sp. B5(2017)]
MPIKTISILGYRGFKNRGTVTFSVPNGKEGSGLTIITGANNAGKSSILECLRARNGYATPSFSAGVRHAAVGLVEIDYVFDGAKESIHSLRKGASETKRIGEKAEERIFVLPSRRAFNPYFSKHAYTRHEHIEGSVLPPQRSPTLSGFEYRLFNILSDEAKLAAFNLHASEVLGFTPDWSIDLSEQGQHFLKFFSADNAHSSDGMGEGIVSIFAIVDSLYDSIEGDVVVIDEPELSLHPALQKRLARLIRKFSSDRQIVISTHSPYFVDLEALKNGAGLVRVTTGANGTKINQLGPSALESIKKLSARNVYNPHVFGLDARELFFQEDGLVLTEGQEDVVLLPEIANQLEQDMPGTFFGWGAGGAGNIKHLCQILSELGFSRVAAVFDGDKAADADELKSLFPDYFSCILPADDIRTKPARPATGAKDGVLDSKHSVRPEYVDSMAAVLDSLRAYMAGQPRTVPVGTDNF